MLLCFSTGSKIHVISPLYFTLNYSTVPEYRMPERRLRVGLKLKSEKMWVRPELSLPLSGQIKNFRSLVSFGYRIDFNHGKSAL